MTLSAAAEFCQWRTNEAGSTYGICGDGADRTWKVEIRPGVRTNQGAVTILPGIRRLAVCQRHSKRIRPYEHESARSWIGDLVWPGRPSGGPLKILPRSRSLFGGPPWVT